MYTKHIHCIYPLCLPFPSHWYPPWDRTCFTFLSVVFKYMLIIQGSFPMVSQACIYRMLIRLAPLLTLLLSPWCPIIQQLSVCFVIPSSYTDTMYFFILFTLSFSFIFPLPPSPSFLQADPLLQSCSLSLFMSVWPYMIIYVFMYMFIF
jgi:hypothetical protein